MPPRVPRILESLDILPRQPGETPYSYRNRRNIALTGESLYERRQRLGAARGKTTAEARGHANVGGLTEYQRRRESTLERFGLTPSQLYWQQADAWLAEHGYTPEATGWSKTRLRQRYTSLKYIAEHSQYPIQPWHIADATQYASDGLLDKNWAYGQVRNRAQAMRDYREHRRSTTGYDGWHVDRLGNPFAGYVDEWWYYH